MGLEDGTSPHSGGRVSYMHGGGNSPPYHLASYSPPPMGSGHSFKSYPDNIVYTSIGWYIKYNAKIHKIYTFGSEYVCVLCM